jgi:hypothetical protein
VRRLAVVAALALVGAGTAATPPRGVPRGGFLVADRLGRLVVLDARGKPLRRLGKPLVQSSVQGLELAADRRHAFESVYRSDHPTRLYRVDLATGRRQLVDKGIGPALSPDKTRLAYVSTAVRNEIIYRTALVVRGLRGGPVRTIPLGPDVPVGTPPELVINWSPDGRKIAVFDGSLVRLVDVANAQDVPSQPAIPGEPALAPVFLDGYTLVVLADCCIGHQHLVAVDLRSGARTAFARLSSPAETIRRLKPGLLLVTTALNELALVSRGHVRVLTRGVTAAAG